ncbi:prolyl oligopeptidase family serine peptidase [Sphingobacterium daejeonense]|uniref:Prolyl oligopeptidase family serine peptidase n=1 Tax=Sphingobacterium daejeonense TaxID=371142 RepID=A0ABW3RMJ1_9SPHI
MVRFNQLFHYCLILTLITLILSSCTKKEVEIESGKGQEHQRLFNIAYGEGLRKQMDVFLHEDRSPNKPFLIFVHGGSWAFGSKLLLGGLQEDMLQKGYSSASINYSFVGPATNYTHLLNDLKAAVDELQKQSSTWNIPKEQYMIIGHSAGAHLSLLFGYSIQNGKDIKGIVSLAGPTDFTNEALVKAMIANKHPLLNLIELMVGKPVNRQNPIPLPDEYKAASPAYQIKHLVPTLIIHGKKDETVHMSQATTLATALKAKKVNHEIIMLDADHSLGLFDGKDPHKISNQMFNWIEKIK